MLYSEDALNEVEAFVNVVLEITGLVANTLTGWLVSTELT